MGMTLNGDDAARVALKHAWERLAQIVDEAKELQSEAAKEPSRLQHPWFEAHVQWLTVFEGELAAVQTVYEALETGTRLPVEDVRAARGVAEKLLEIIEQTRERVPQPELA